MGWGHSRCGNCGFGLASSKGPVSAIEGSEVYEPVSSARPKKGLVKKRVLRWRGKSYDSFPCMYCGKESLHLKHLDVGPVKRNGNNIVAIRFTSTPCSKCLYRMMDDLEKAASELRAAQLGGVWSEEEMRREE